MKLKDFEVGGSTMKKLDINVTGSMGLYSITPRTTRSKRWLAEHCPGVIHLGDALMCEGGDRCRAIVAAADRAKLRVAVNGVDMTGYGTRED